MKQVTWPVMTGLILAPVAGFTQEQRVEAWGARKAATCPDVRKVPSAAVAAQLVRCGLESQSMANGQSRLIEDLQIEVGGPTRFAIMYNIFVMPEADPSKTVYPIRSSWTWSVCILRADAKLSGDANLNCRETPVTQGKGVCWQTTFGDWKCTMNGTSGLTQTKLRPR